MSAIQKKIIKNNNNETGILNIEAPKSRRPRIIRNIGWCEYTRMLSS
jgi:hypothetical protein